MNSEQSGLMGLKNLGTATVNILHAVGINSYEELSQAGPVEVYCKIQDRGIHVSKVMLYALQGALMDVHWNELSPELKSELVDQAERKKPVKRARAEA